MTHVSYSQLNTWRRCRRRWWFSYVGQLELPYHVSPALWLGSGVHEALDAYYDDITRNPNTLTKAFMDWARDDVINNIQPKITGLINERQILLDLDKQQVLGMGMLENYGKEAPALDSNFVVLTTEQEFNLGLGVEVMNPVTQVKEEVTYKGRIDGIIQMKDTGQYFLLEHKTATQFQEKKLVLDQQATSYIWAAQILTGVEISGVYYNILRKQLKTDKVRAPLVYRLSVERSRAAVRGFPEHVRMIVKDMDYAAGNNLYYHSPNEDCSWCPFFTPCSMIQDEADPRNYIEEHYKTKEEIKSDIEGDVLRDEVQEEGNIIF